MSSRFLVGLCCLISTPAQAEDLPKHLLLKCEGTTKTLLSSMDSYEKKFEVMLRLKDGELSEVDTVWLTTKRCELLNGTIACSDRLTVPLDKGKSERRELKAFIVRDTGEYTLSLQTRSLDAAGKQTGGLMLNRVGVCRSVGKPIF